MVFQRTTTIREPIATITTRCTPQVATPRKCSTPFGITITARTLLPKTYTKGSLVSAWLSIRWTLGFPV